MKTYISPYDPQWPDRYIDEAEKVRSVAAVDLELHHIGSTAIPGMVAKSCIDMLGVVDTFEEGKKLVKPLAALGYEYRGENGIEERHYFSKIKGGRVHLHVFPKGSKEIHKHLHFVEVMTGNPDLLCEFIEVKRRLEALYPADKSRYQQEKASFYARITEMPGLD